MLSDRHLSAPNIRHHTDVAPSRADGTAVEGTSGHLPALDGLRGVAVAVVVAFHANWLTGGYLGVDVFFVLSGFLITRLLLAEHARIGRIDLKRFWARRARRLLPALLLLVAVAAIAERVRGRIDGPAGGRVDVLGALTYTTNWLRLRSGAGYWANFGGPALLDHTWSLAIEEQFYLLWPLVMIALLRFVRRSGLRVLALATVTAAAAAWSLIAFAHSQDASRVYMGTDTRAIALLAGATVAAFAAWRPTGRGVVPRLFAVAGACFLAYAFANLPGTALRTYRGGLLACSIAAALVIAAIAHARPPALARPLALRPLRYLGERSYGIYLWHWPIMVGFGVAKEPLSPSWRRLVAIGLTLIVAEVSYRAVEQPIRQRGLAAFGSRWRPPLGATVATVIALAAVFAPTADAVSSAAVTLPLVPVTTTPASTASSTSTSADVVTSVPGATSPPSATTLLPTTVPPTPTTTIDTAVLAPIAPPAGRAARVLYVGDSVGWFLAIGGDDDAKRLGIQVTNGAEPECVLTHQPIKRRAREGAVPLVFDKRCSDAVNGYRKLAARVRPDIVVIAFGASLLDENEIAPGQWHAPCTPELDAWFQNEIRQITADLGSTGAHVYWTTQAYYRSEVTSHTPQLDAQTECENAKAAEVARDTDDALGIVRLGEWTCPTRQCLDQRDGIELRPDGTHFRDAAATLANVFILSQVYNPPPWQK